MENEVCNKKLSNVTLLDQRPRSDQQNFLNACDIALVSLSPGMKGAGVPSRLYNIMAAGKPLITVMGEGTEAAFVVEEEQIGWFVPTDQPERLVEAIHDARSNPERLAQMGGRARMAAVAKYSRKKVISDYVELIESFGSDDVESVNPQQSGPPNHLAWTEII
jgi:glycosyltransferase involved in cell wall biosynthesis